MAQKQGGSKSKKSVKPEPAWLVKINRALAKAMAGMDPAALVVGYVRISEADKDEGVESQADKLVEYARNNGIALSHIYCDNDLSGAKADRPGFVAMSRLVRKGPTKRVLMRDVDRLARDYDIGYELFTLGSKQGVVYTGVANGKTYDLASDDDDRSSFWLKIDEAAKRRAVDRKNLKTMVTRHAAQGRQHGGSRCFGYGVNYGPHPITKEDIIDRNALCESEVEVLREGRDRIFNGETQKSIVEDFNRRGIPTAEGALWAVGQFGRQMLLERYVEYDLGEHIDPVTGERCVCLDNPEGNGTRVHRPEGGPESRHRGTWPAIFTRAEHDAMRGMLRKHSRAKNPDMPRQRNGDYWMTGLAECGGHWADGRACGHGLIGQTLQRKRKGGNGAVRVNGKFTANPDKGEPTVVKVPRYRCEPFNAKRQPTGCGTVYRDAAALETYVAEQVIAMYENPEVVAKVRAEAIGDDSKALEVRSRIELYDGQHMELVNKQIEAMGKPRYSATRYERQLDAIEATLTKLRAELETLGSDDTRELLSDLDSDGGIRELWASRGSRWKLDMASRLIERVVVGPVNVYSATFTDQTGKTWRFDESAVDIVWRF
jgi:DNA invertase Pin-like site-specific DNA recombinase